MRVFFGFLGLFVYERLLRRASVVHLSADDWRTWVFAFILYDFCYYWQHRLGHTVGLFWAYHSVLESRREFLALEAVRMAGIAMAAGAAGVWFGGVRDPRVMLPLATFAVASLGALWIATRKPVAVADARRAAA